MIEYVEHPTYGTVRVSRRKGSRSIRIGLAQDGEVRLSLPFRTSLQQGLQFLNDKKDWIEKHRQESNDVEHGARIGKFHTLKLVVDSTGGKTTIVQNTIIVRIADDATADEVKSKIESASKRALKKEAQQLLPKQLQQHAQVHGYAFTSVSVKPLKTRWGSCSSQNDIILNTYLMQLPWRLIDYVLLHELAHTKHHNHSASFWATLEKTLPDAQIRKREIKKYPTSIFDTRISDNFMT